MVLGDGEILANYWQCAGGAGGAEVVETALKKIAIRKHGKRHGATLLVFRGELGGVEILHEDSFTWGSFLDFGYDSRPLRSQGGGEIAAAGAYGFRGRAQFAQRDDGFTQFFALAGHNSGEDVRSGWGQEQWYRRGWTGQAKAPVPHMSFYTGQSVKDDTRSVRKE
jgi:hypothetical protein